MSISCSFRKFISMVNLIKLYTRKDITQSINCFQNATVTFEIKDCNNFKIKIPLYMLDVQNPLMLLKEK